MKNIIGLLLVLFSSTAVAEKWVCIPEQATGFNYINGKWQALSGKADNKYIIRAANNEELKRHKNTLDSKYVVMPFGSNIPLPCRGNFHEGVITCSYFDTHIRFNRDNNRFLSVYHTGYVDGIDTNDNSPHMTIGKCSPL